MKRLTQSTDSRIATTRSISLAVPALCALSLALITPAARAQQPAPAQQQAQSSKESATFHYEKPDAMAFPSPQTAAAALAEAARRNDESRLMAILGPEAKDIIHWTDDPNEIAEQRQEFVSNYDRMHRLVKEADGTVALYVGAANWPIPIPIVKVSGSWYFDASLGKQEILYRRVGRNEMEAMDVARALVDAEKDYYSSAHAYTNKFNCTGSGETHDGLYWKTGDSGIRSPIGPYLAQAGITDTTTDGHRPYHGYFYRILLQAPVAPDGDGTSAARNGFLIVAFPAEYRSSGVMTFLVNQSGGVYEKDLGPNTASLAMQISSANNDASWKKAE